jgi:murein DD-endopeptidase MepM/ murein hydrolase activator NlpD
MKKDLLISVIFTFLLLLFHNCLILDKKEIIDVSHDIQNEIQNIKKEYGINIDSFFVEEGEITPNLFISNLFSNYNISNTISSEIISKTKNVFDVRKIQRGNKYKVFMSDDTLKQVKYIVYEQSAAKYVVFDFRDTLNVFLGEKEIRTEIKTGSGIITSSLWETMSENDLNPLLANDLSDIYAWTIDFFGLQNGDKFKIIYEAKYVDTIQIGYGKIKAAYFQHYEKDIYAIPFYQDTLWSFFNINGESLRKAFLKAPLKYSHISSGYSNSRLHPILKIYRAHHGVDYSAPAGTPVYSIGDGVVTEASYGAQAGNYVYIKHNGVYTTGYLHLSKFESGIKVGSSVKQGEVIGYVGSTGLSTGAHLDFRVWMNGNPINPLTIDAPPVEPIKEENKEKFEKISEFIVDNLNKIDYNYIPQTK